MAATPKSEPSYSTVKDKSSLPWYRENLEHYWVAETKDLLENYSKVPRDKQLEHIYKIRDEAWNIRAYPCVGLGIWLVPYIRFSPAYSSIVDRLKSGASMVDVGAHLGGDFRQCVHDGAPSDKMYGIDIVSHWDIGYHLYRDEDSFKGKLITADITSEDNPELNALNGKMDIISISAVLHQWPWEKQVEVAKRLVKFSSGKDTVLVGHQIGNVDAKKIVLMDTHAYRHDTESWKKMWQQIGDETGTKWEAQARLLDWKDLGWDPNDMTWMESGARVLDFVVTRVA